MLWITKKGPRAPLASLLQSMVLGRMSSALLQRLLAELRASRPRAKTDHERRAIDGAMADLVDGIMAGGDAPGVRAKSRDREEFAQVAERPMSKHSPFYGLGLKEACPKLLSLSESKTPQTPREIWEQLKADGFTSAHSNPVHSVNDALRRRAKTHGDVMLVDLASGARQIGTRRLNSKKFGRRSVEWAVATRPTTSSALGPG